MLAHWLRPLLKCLMGCNQSYPLPEGKDNSLLIPRAISIIKDFQIDLAAVSPKQLSPLRNAINAEEVARPQSKESQKICHERCAMTDITSSMNESCNELSVINENEVLEDARLVDTVVDAQNKEQTEKKKAFHTKLNPSILIDVLSIESKTTELRTSLKPSSCVKCSVKEMRLAPKHIESFIGPLQSFVASPKANDVKVDTNVADAIKLKDRVLALCAVFCLLLVYIATLAFSGWLVAKTIQSIRYLATPVVHRLLQLLFDANQKGFASTSQLSRGISILNSSHDFEVTQADSVLLSITKLPLFMRFNYKILLKSKIGAFMNVKDLISRNSIRVIKRKCELTFFLINGFGTRLKTLIQKQRFQSKIMSVFEIVIDNVGKFIDGDHHLI